VYGSTEMGATPSLSWLGVLGYSGASAFPAILISILGPKIREQTQNRDAFSTSDFGRQRYGRAMQFSILCISIFYMFIYIVAEMTSIANVYKLVTNSSSMKFGIGVTVAMGVVTLFYTAVAGLPASIVTDKFQGIMMALLVLTLTIAVCSFEENQVSPEEWKEAANWTPDGLMAAITLIVAISSAEMFNQANWQRVWAAQDVPSLRKGFCLGSIMVFLLVRPIFCSVFSSEYLPSRRRNLRGEKIHNMMLQGSHFYYLPSPPWGIFLSCHGTDDVFWNYGDVGLCERQGGI